MPYRGRLIKPFVAVLGLLDAEQTRGNTIGGEVVAGYDDDFREPEAVTVDATGERVGSRVEREVRVKCQVEPTTYEQLRMTPAGNNPGTLYNLVIHFCELEKVGLVDGDGRARIGTRDRLIRLETVCGKTVTAFRNPPGAFCVQARPGGYGIGLSRNLLIATFEERQIVPSVAT